MRGDQITLPLSCFAAFDGLDETDARFVRDSDQGPIKFSVGAAAEVLRERARGRGDGGSGAAPDALARAVGATARPAMLDARADVGARVADERADARADGRATRSGRRGAARQTPAQRGPLA